MFMHNKRLQYTVRVASGRLPGIEKFANLYVNTSQGDGDVEGPWIRAISGSASTTLRTRCQSTMATVELDDDDALVVEHLAERTASATSDDPTTGVDLGAGPGAGRLTDDDKGGASDIDDAVKMAEAI